MSDEEKKAVFDIVLHALRLCPCDVCANYWKQLEERRKNCGCGCHK